MVGRRRAIFLSNLRNGMRVCPQECGSSFSYLFGIAFRTLSIFLFIICVRVFIAFRYSFCDFIRYHRIVAILFIYLFIRFEHG